MKLARVFICDKSDAAGCDNFGTTRQFRDCLLQILALTATNTIWAPHDRLQRPNSKRRKTSSKMEACLQSIRKR